MNKLIGGPLDGAVLKPDPSGLEDVSMYFSANRMCQYHRRSDGDYDFMRTFDDDEVEKVKSGG